MNKNEINKDEILVSDENELSWQSTGLSPKLLDLVKKAGFEKPTPVQAASIPLALEGHDIIASAQTGTGKTASFVFPLIERLSGKEGTYGIILCPTREIAQQSQAVFEAFGPPMGVRSIVLIGGVDMKLDEKAIGTYPQVIIATPGRLCDHLERGNIWLDFIQWVVLDEADRMLEMGFSDQLSRIMRDIPNTRQTLVFSATIPMPVQKLAQKILHHPKQVKIGKTMSAATTVEQRVIWMKEESKNRELRRLIREEPGRMIVFTRSKDAASRLWRSLHSSSFTEATVVHSDLRQMDREQALEDFKSGKYRILIATDVMGRGIHVEEVAHVVNYDFPRDVEDYIHRIGRTGRQGATGKATSFATGRDQITVDRVEKTIGQKLTSIHTDRPTGGGNPRPEGRPQHPIRPQNGDEKGGQKRRRRPQRRRAQKP